MYYKKIEGPRIYLSPINPDDAQIYTTWLNDLSMTVNVGLSTSNYSLKSEREALGYMASGGHNYAIILKNDDGDILLGNCSLKDINSMHGSGEIGIFIGDAKYRGLGYGPEAMKLLMAYGFKMLNLNNIILKVFEFNKYAIKAYEKIGFQITGRRRKCYYLNNKFYDNVYMDILKSEFDCDYLDNIMP